VLARVIIFATRRELVDKLVDRQIAIARKKGRKKERKKIAFGKVLWSCGYHVVRKTAMPKGEGKRKTLHLGSSSLCIIVNPIKILLCCRTTFSVLTSH